MRLLIDGGQDGGQDRFDWRRNDLTHPTFNFTHPTFILTTLMARLRVFPVWLHLHIA